MAVCYLAPALGVCGSALSINRGAVESTLWTNWVVTTWLKLYVDLTGFGLLVTAEI